MSDHSATPPPEIPTPLLREDGADGAAMAVASALFEQSPFSKVLYDPAGRILRVNRSFERLFGLRQASIPADYSILTDPRLEAAGLLPQVRRAFEGHQVVLPPVFYDASAIDGGGRRSWTQGHLFPIRDAHGALVAVVLVHVDLTDRIEAEQARREATDRLELQAIELESQTEQLQQQAAEMEQQSEELQAMNEALLRTNEELAAAEAYVRGVLGSIGDPFVVHDAEWRFRYVNEAAAAIFAGAGFARTSDIIGRVVWEAYPEIVGTAFEREMRRAGRERVPVTFTEFSARSGRWSELRCYPMPDGGVATLWKDVTEVKRAEEARHFLARVGELLSETLDTEEIARRLAFLLVPRLADWTSVQLLDADGALRQVAVAHVDPAKVEWARELNERYPPDPEQPYGAHAVARSGQSALLAEIPEELLAAAAQDEEHLRILRDLGFASALTVPLAARGRVVGVMSLVTTSESQRRYGKAELALAEELGGRAALAIENAMLYQEALHARVEADEANRTKAQFLATMSHELRTPLNAIGGYTQLLELGVHGPIAPAQAEALERVRRNQQHLLSLINDVLNFAKIEAGHLTYDLERVTVRELLSRLEPLVTPQLAARSLRYESVECDPELAVTADAEKANQVLINLVSNAIKFTEAGGSVRILCGADESRVRIAVADTGIGIPEDRLEAVFEPFVQVMRGPGHRPDGTGLGLAISRDLARGMGGDLRVESVVNVGSTFELLLPRA
jgi:PAS domain S-box-containing protein